MDEETRKNNDTNNEKDLPFPMVGKSSNVEQLTKQINKLSKARSDIKIEGESGVGKGAIAKNIYYLGQSTKASEAFISINFTSVDDRELNAILLGTESNESLDKTVKLGVLHTASGGTVLLEDIDEASFRNQMKVLSVLNERSTLKSDVRFIITMKENLEALRDKRKILDELYSKMTSFESLIVPPLRERPEDIPILVRHFASELCEQLGMAELVIDINALDVLVRQPWKENIRELKAVVDKSVLFSNSGRFMLPPELVDEKTEVVKMISNIEIGTGFALEQSLDLIEKGIIERSLQKFGHNQSRAALFLGLTEQTLRYKLKRLGIISSRIVKSKFS